jgi:DNA-binding sugar fermentation-stimulating protein
VDSSITITDGSTARHQRELETIAAVGERAVMLFMVQRRDSARIDAAGEIDPT